MEEKSNDTKGLVKTEEPVCSTRTDYVSNVVIKDEIIIMPDEPPIEESESTISDSEVWRHDIQDSCQICVKYRSMFIILNNHDCTYKESDGSCDLCQEISHWSDCLKKHKESHVREIEVTDNLSETTASDNADKEIGRCDVCFKYNYMMAVLRRHGCESEGECLRCNEISQWLLTFQQHKRVHINQEGYMSEEEELSDSTASDDVDIICVETGKNCDVCVKYKSMLNMLRDYHQVHVGMSIENCKDCDEIDNLSMCFKVHEESHEAETEPETDPLADLDSAADKKHPKKLHKEKNCKICFKLNSITVNLVNNHKCEESDICETCDEVSHWLACIKSHKDLYQNDVKEDNYTRTIVEMMNKVHVDCRACLNYVTAMNKLSVGHNYRQICGCDICGERTYWIQCFERHRVTHKQAEMEKKKREKQKQIDEHGKLLKREEVRLKRQQIKEQEEKQRREMALQYKQLQIEERRKRRLHRSHFKQPQITERKKRKQYRVTFLTDFEDDEKEKSKAVGQRKQRVQHETQSKRVQKQALFCVTCEKTFTNEREYKLHQHVLDRGLSSGVEECNKCNKRFQTKQQLQKHLKDHVPEDWAYRCTECYKGFNNAKVLERHKLSAHVNPTETDSNHYSEKNK